MYNSLLLEYVHMILNEYNMSNYAEDLQIASATYYKLMDYQVIWITDDQTIIKE